MAATHRRAARAARTGRRGPDCVPAADQERETERLRCAAAAYADDLVAVTGSLSEVQAAKERYAAWARLKGNVSKCAVTAGILHGEYWDQAPGTQCGKRMLQSLQSRLTGTIRIDGHPVPFLQPHEPYTYLGIELIMTLTWKHLYDSAMRQTRQAGEALAPARYKAHLEEKLRVLRTCI